MKLPIDKILIIICLFCVTHAKAQIAASNPLEWMALAEGNELLNSEIEKQINGQTKTAVLQNTIAAEFTKMHEWEKKYNAYLKTASGMLHHLRHVLIYTTMQYASSSHWENLEKPYRITHRVSSQP